MFFITLLYAEHLVGHSLLGKEAIDQASLIRLKTLMDFLFVDLAKHRVELLLATIFAYDVKSFVIVKFNILLLI